MVRVDRATVFGVVGSMALIIGAYLPWIKRNPNFTDGVDLIYIYGMDTGFHDTDMALVVAALIVIAVSFLIHQRKTRAATFLFVGVLSVLVCANLFRNHQIGYSSGYVPDVGWYLALLGGFILCLTGGAYILGELSTHLRNKT